MMPFSAVTLKRASIVATIALLALFTQDLWRLRQQQQHNARIATTKSIALAEADPLPVVFAEALRQAHDGNFRQAHDLYARVAMQARDNLQPAAEFNHANLLLREAMVLQENDNAAQARPLLELAKEAYRKVLRIQPQAWDARYNLERALRLAPEPPEVEGGEGPAPKQRERAPTTMRGESLGLP